MLNPNVKNQDELDASQKAAAAAAQEEALRAAELQRINAQIAQEEYKKMMKSYKLLDDSPDRSIKTLNSTSMEFKTLDGEAEALSSGARKHFENTAIPVPGPADATNATPFFGDIMPLIACVELSMKEAYNGLDFLLSFNRIMDANKIKGEVLNAARIIQKNIDDNYMALRDCH